MTKKTTTKNKVYCSPRGHAMQEEGSKATDTVHSFPVLSFQLHDHWGATEISSDGGATVLGVELLAKGPALLGHPLRAHLFRGALDCARIGEQHARLGSAWPRASQERMVLMRGPGGVGEAAMAVRSSSNATTGKREMRDFLRCFGVSHNSSFAKVSTLRSWLPFGGGAQAPRPIVYTCFVCSVALDWRHMARTLLDWHK